MRQLNEQTWAHQSSQWTSLMIAYTRQHRIFPLDLSDETCDLELFIDRCVPLYPYSSPPPPTGADDDERGWEQDAL